MASIVLGQVASAVGGSIAGGLGAAVGLGFGEFIGRSLDNHILNGRSSYKVTGTRLADLSVQTSTYGRMIPVLYGNCKIAGNIICSTPIKEDVHHHRSGGKFAGPKVVRSQYSYCVSLAISLCKGPIDSVIRVWADNKEIDPTEGVYRIYKGDEEQMPDPLLESIYGMGKTPAYRGLAYLVIENFPLGEFGNRIPNFTFEVRRKLTANDKATHLQTEELVQSMVLIPGSGEFVYDTQVQRKAFAENIDGKTIRTSRERKINLNNRSNKADALVALDQLQETCPNVNWVAPVVGWFADSLDAKVASIKPGVEYNHGTITLPDKWGVGSFNRSSAYLISKDKYNNPVYGGTISDSSMIRYLDELRSRNLKVMLYPMFFMDVPNKPWRGRLSGSAESIASFFNKPNGYNNFILHYAHLVKGKVDAFVIGSELIGLTKVKDNNNNFPAVDELVMLARKVKEILGDNVVVTYAADWSEYHHTDGGWYNLDKLWACEAIDAIGIDAYFPLTEFTTNHYSEEDVVKGWESGEGYDFYYEDSTRTIKKPLSPEWAWKNIQYWWSNYHTNPDGKRTDWQPKSKKIWFTEFGFPSVDLATNQPNVFYDPTSSENNLPRYSKGRVDFYAQRVGITATLKKWQNSEMVERMFLWTWDARPYPFWPDMLGVWSDGGCWSRGHWVNGKFGTSTLAAIVSELCSLAGLCSQDIDVSDLNELVDGYVLPNQCSIRDAIEALQQAYFFDIVESDGVLKFIPRRLGKLQHISGEELIPVDNELLNLIRTQECELPKRVDILYINKIADYSQGISHSSRQVTLSDEVETISLPLVMGTGRSQVAADIHLYNRWLERNLFNFKLPIKYSFLQPGDIVKINNLNKATYKVRITNTTLEDKRCIKISGVAADNAVYDSYREDSLPVIEKIENLNAGKTKLIIMNLPILPIDREQIKGLYLAAYGYDENWQGANIFCPDDSQLSISSCTIGILVTKLDKNENNQEDSNQSICFEVQLYNGELSSISQQEILNWKNLAVIDQEIIQFEKAVYLGDHKYKISGIHRGRLNSEKKEHQVGEQFILLDRTLQKFNLTPFDKGKTLTFTAVTFGQSINEGTEWKFDYLD